MGEAIYIRELAEQVIRFSGFEPDKDIQIDYIGLRPGERLEEKLVADNETLEATDFPRINRLVRKQEDLQLHAILAELKPACIMDPVRPEAYRNRRYLRGVLRSWIPSIEELSDEPEY
jgi:FlaA1/EpsC-like NDP-sugar epimerase